jgi:drug/metabolite transporter (DMT)-like permease
MDRGGSGTQMQEESGQHRGSAPIPPQMPSGADQTQENEMASDIDIQEKTPSLVSTYIALFLAVLFWGSSFPATKMVLLGFPPLVYVFLRFAGASLFFLVFLSRRRRVLSRSTHLKLALMSLFEPVLYFTFESMGMQYTSASSASIIIAAVPAVVALLARLFIAERLSPREWAGVILSVAGVILLAAFDDNPDYAASSMLGNLLILGAVLSAALYMILARHLSTEVTAMELTSYQIIYGGIIFLPIFLLRMRAVQWSEVGAESVLALLFLIIFATLVAFFSYNFALTRITASRAAVFLNGIPVVSVIVSAALLGERLGELQFIGGAVVITGVTLTNLRRRSRRAGGKKGSRPVPPV